MATAVRPLAELELAQRCLARDRDAIRAVVVANNQRLFRAAWSILKDRGEAEEAVQSAYVSAFASLDSFEGRSSLSTWLTRIVVNESLGRLRAQKRRRDQLEGTGVAVLEDHRETLMRGSEARQPDVALAREQMRLLLEQAVAALPEAFRTVFVLREVEGLSGDETAEVLGLPVSTVKTRLHRARRKLQQILAPQIGTALSESFPFAGADCAALTERVLAKLGL